MEFLENIPDVLYKYRLWSDRYHRRVLTHNEIFLSSADLFNDPFDMTLPFRYREEDLTPDNIFRKLYLLGKDQWPDMPEDELHRRCYERQMSGAFNNGQYWREEYERYKKDMNARFGILSLTSKNDNLLMWSHYAASHYGFCVGFDKYLLYGETMGMLSPVIYAKEIPSVGLFDDNLEGFTRVLITKSTDWEYEDEYRVTKINGFRTRVPLPDQAIVEIVLGYKMPEVEKQEVVDLARTKFPHARVFESQMNLENFKMDMIPILNFGHPSAGPS